MSSTNLTAPDRVHTIVDHWGGIAPEQIFQALDGTPRFDPTDAPISIIHGTADGTVQFSEAEALRDAYIETGVPYRFHPLEGADHGAWNSTVDGQSLPELAFDFVVEQQGLLVSDP